MITARPISFPEAASDLREFGGATLTWCTLVVSHGEFVLVASGLSRGTAQIWFISTQYLDLPARMHHARLRAASDADTAALRRRLPHRLSRQLKREEHLVVDCDEGSYAIWARRIAVRWVEEQGFIQSMWGDVSGPLWPGGPPFAEL